MLTQDDSRVRKGAQRRIRLNRRLKDVVDGVGAQEVDRRIFVGNELDLDAVQAGRAL